MLLAPTPRVKSRDSSMAVDLRDFEIDLFTKFDSFESVDKIS